MTLTGIQGAANPAPTFYIHRVKTKLAMGEYHMEDISCFCGSTDAYPITERDRYGFNHRMVLCKSCSLIYATPRMTQDSYRKFYENEYRQIYDWGSMEKEENFSIGISNATTLKEALNELDIYPKVVFDIGCNSGAWLKPFQDIGSEVYGVDYGLEGIQYGKSLGLNISAGNIDELIKIGKKADLIILNHFIEHSLNLERDLRQIHNLLSDDGILFINTPSLYTWHLSVLFQNAHPYQFTSKTLDYIMQCCGFEDIYLDERIMSIWHKSDSIRSKSSIPKNEVQHIINFLYHEQRPIPEIRTINKFPLKERKKNIKIALKYKLPDINALFGNLNNKDTLIIGGGPSIEQYINEIKSRQLNGAKIISIERMYSWCLINGIIPDYIIVMDASDDVIESFDNIHPNTIHLIATQCKQDIIDKLKDYKTYIFNTPQKGIDMASMWHEHDYDKVTQINAGGSVTLCAISIAMALGSRNFHIFGFDCHVTNNNYANNITGIGDQSQYIDINIDGRIFKTTAGYISFMQQFFNLLTLARKLEIIDSVKIYGDSMVSWASKENISDKGEV